MVDEANCLSPIAANELGTLRFASGRVTTLLVRHWEVSIDCAMMCDVPIVVRPMVGSPIVKLSVIDGFSAGVIKGFIG